jgi:ribulose kinase
MRDSSPLVLGLDCSTTACKAIVWDCRGRSIGRGYSSLALLAPQPAWHEQPAESWWESMTQAIRQAVSQVDDGRLKALCIALPFSNCSRNFAFRRPLGPAPCRDEVLMTTCCTDPPAPSAPR